MASECGMHDMTVAQNCMYAKTVTLIKCTHLCTSHVAVQASKAVPATPAAANGAASPAQSARASDDGTDGVTNTLGRMGLADAKRRALYDSQVFEDEQGEAAAPQVRTRCGDSSQDIVLM